MGFSVAEARQVASYLASHTAESDGVFSWAQTNAHVVANRRPASKQAYVLSLVYAPQGLQAKARDKLMSDLRRRRPPYVVLLAESGWPWELPGVTFPVETFPKLVDFAADNYTHDAVFANSAAYRLCPPASWCPVAGIR